MYLNNAKPVSTHLFWLFYPQNESAGSKFRKLASKLATVSETNPKSQLVIHFCNQKIMSF